MKMKELDGMTMEELNQKMTGLKKELFDLRMLSAGGKLDKPHRVPFIRKDVARIQTLLTRQRKTAIEKGKQKA